MKCGTRARGSSSKAEWKKNEAMIHASCSGEEREKERRESESWPGHRRPGAFILLHAGFHQALFVLTVATDASSGVEKRRLIVMLVAVDGAGVLRQVDPSHELVEISARMVEADRLDGNGPWRKLSARITPKADGGATLHVDVL